jgi:hypothetical protein
VKRLLPVNEVLTARHAAALRIAADLGRPVNAVHIGNGASGTAVFHEDRQGSGGARCACNLRSPHWRQCRANAAVAALRARLAVEAVRAMARRSG